MIEYEIKPQSKFSLGINELWLYKELFYFFTWRDIKVKYKQTYLGIAWAILQPFFLMLVFSYFFGSKLKIPSDDIPYPIFVYSGLMFWNIFSTGLSHAGDSMVSNSNIIKKIYFPRLIIPVSAILVSVFDFFMTVIIYIMLLVYYHPSINYIKLLICFPAALVLTIVATLGLGTFLSALNVKYRDFRYVVPFFVQALLFLTPVIYPVSSMKETWVRYLLACNPMSGAVTLARSVISNQEIDPVFMSISISSAILLLIIGIGTFKKTEAFFADFA
jgi:lipopolysaccharide transport system permease protein